MQLTPSLGLCAVLSLLTVHVQAQTAAPAAAPATPPATPPAVAADSRQFVEMPAAAQQLMARATGNYRRGNERGAARHPRRRAGG